MEILIKTAKTALIVSLFALFSCGKGTVPSKYEFRGAWVASVKNIDWPSKPGLAPEKQRNEYARIAAWHAEAGMNALVVQVRPATDAFFPSEFEPWSEWLTGKQGLAPDPLYDPLQFMIDETHRNGMEFHAWFNPYRAVVDYDSAKAVVNHISRLQPSWFVKYGSNLYFDPGVPEARTYLVDLIRDVVRRYNVDAIHFDDYFYPYKIAGVDFPDSVSFETYGRDFENKDDWRRDNVNQLVRDLGIAIKQEKPWVRFGISPFGVWRNGDKDPMGSATTAGQTNYDDLYADILLWLDNEWIDYVVPQLYWHIGFKPAEYKTLVEWWANHSNGRQLYIGQATYRIEGDRAEEWKNPSEMPRHLRYNHNYPEVHGNVFYNTRSILENKLGFTDSLRNDFYRVPALTPPMLWIDSLAPSKVEGLSVKSFKNGNFLSWKPGSEAGGKFVVYRFRGSGMGDINDPRNILEIVEGHREFITDRSAVPGKKYTYVVTALDRLNNESEVSAAVTVKTVKK